MSEHPDHVRFQAFRERWPLFLGMLVIAVPTIIALAKEPWQTDLGAHGPIVLTMGLWLLYHDGLRFTQPGGAGLARAAPGALAGLAAYVFGRAYDFISLEYFGLYLTFLAFVVMLCGFSALRRHAFALFYLLLVVPPPGWVITSITAPLQTLVSASAEVLSRAAGLPVAREGVLLYVGPYQLLVEDACAGLNSLFGLVAVCLLYIYLAHKASWRHALILMLALVPIGIIANVLRIMGLILICYNLGDAAAQGFMHATTGVIMFALGLALVMTVDRWLVSPLMVRKG